MAEPHIPSDARKGLVLGGPEHAASVAQRFHTLAESRVPEAERDLSSGERRARRLAAVASAATGMMGPRGHGHGQGVTIAADYPNDPMWYWQANNLPYDLTKEHDLQRVRQLCRMIRVAHPVIGSALEVYAKYPLTGLELSSKDKKVTQFHEELFFDENGLNYEEYLPRMGLEYWTVGEALPLGHFNDVLGVWEMDELINPDDVRIDINPFDVEPFMKMRVPEWIRDVLTTRKPVWQYAAIMDAAPELMEYAREGGGLSSQDDDDARGYMTMSPMLMRHLKYEMDTFHPRGLPILLRGFRTLLQEERLNSAQDAISTRLATPLILSKIGATAQDLGTNQPWIPTPQDLDDFEGAVLDALMGDFKMITTHFATDMRPVFGRESMPRFDTDFDRITERLLQVFGMSKTLLSGASSGQTYAADALNRDLITQLLAGYQKILRRFFHHRASIVAEAQEQYDYTLKGGKRYPIMEEVLVIDEETGEQRIKEQPKLLVPTLKFKAMTLSNETEMRTFLEALRREGVPISQSTRLQNIPIDLEEEYEKTREEQVEQAVQAQITRKETYHRLVREGLPVPKDLIDDFGSGDPEGPVVQSETQIVPGIGMGEPASTDGLAPTPDDAGVGPGDGTGDSLSDVGNQPPSGEGSNVTKLPRNKIMQRQRPAESDEQRKGMPRPAMLGSPPHIGLRATAALSADIPLEDDDLEDQETG